MKNRYLYNELIGKAIWSSNAYNMTFFAVFVGMIIGSVGDVHLAFSDNRLLSKCKI